MPSKTDFFKNNTSICKGNSKWLRNKSLCWAWMTQDSSNPLLILKKKELTNSSLIDTKKLSQTNFCRRQKHLAVQMEKTLKSVILVKHLAAQKQEKPATLLSTTLKQHLTVQTKKTTTLTTLTERMTQSMMRMTLMTTELQIELIDAAIKDWLVYTNSRFSIYLYYLMR